MWIFLLLALSNPCGGSDAVCQTKSGQVCNRDGTNHSLYHCDQDQGPKQSEVRADEGGRINLEAYGDKSGYGCSFEFKYADKDATCCYIHEDREESRGKKLCGGVSKQPEECRQPGGGEYRVSFKTVTLQSVTSDWSKSLTIFFRGSGGLGSYGG